MREEARAAANDIFDESKKKGKKEKIKVESLDDKKEE